VLFYTLGVEYYYTPNCYTEQNSVSFSIRVLVLFSIFVVLGVVLNDTEHCSVCIGVEYYCTPQAKTDMKKILSSTEPRSVSLSTTHRPQK
jgi:hypothetical protein